MAKRQRLEVVLKQIDVLKADATSEETHTRLREILKDESCHAVAKAAGLIESFALTDLDSALHAAFERFMEDPLRTDKGCTAKTAIAQALVNTSSGHADLYLRGLSHRQLEPDWGGSKDTAAPLRAICAIGVVVDMAPDDALIEVAPLLADPETPARTGGVQALKTLGGSGAEAVLRFKACVGDEDPAVVEACFGAIVAINPAAIPFVQRFLGSPQPELAEAAAFALGASRLDEAFVPLRSWWERSLRGTHRRVALFAIATLRSEEATAFLLSLVETENLTTAGLAIEALRIQAYVDTRLRDRLLGVVQERGEATLIEAMSALERAS